MIMKLGKLQLKKKKFMERAISSLMGLFLLWAIVVFDMFPRVSANVEVDALNALKNNLVDPKNALRDWDPTQANPCRWYHVTCNFNNSVTRVDLGDGNLSGQLVPQLGQLPNLQYLELYSNNISGRIPDELGNLTNLVSLDLYLNRLTGPIPNTLGNLEKLRFLRLNNNSLSGNIPMSLTSIVSLQVIDLSNNQLTGDIPVNGSFAFFTPISFQNNPGLKPQKFSPPPLNFQTPLTLSAGGLSSPESSPTSFGAAAPRLSSGPANEISPAPSPSLGNSTSSSMLPISSGSLLLALLLAIFSGF